MGKRYLTQPQLRERYGGISDMTVWRWVRTGRIPEPALFGTRNYFDEAELDEADRRAKAEYRRAQAEPPKHGPPPRKNNTETIRK
ncbi:helix-turn-helix domain-containing protein [Rhizobium sp. L43]|uniref:helix-turn-helix transcriptional regulator n=1 Tax=Rhizobium sp. L43 TaxID=2035452 RepID=UPI000BEA1D8F|nr:helix-turn-helix domain-containing protein [Rhizobium sp. L43]PDS74691.1 DNA-binding protein [Rhizobium sp. L43]